MSENGNESGCENFEKCFCDRNIISDDDRPVTPVEQRLQPPDHPPPLKRIFPGKVIETLN